MVYATLRPGRHLYDAGVLPPARHRRRPRTICEILAPRSTRCRRTTRSRACCAGRRISGDLKRWRTRSSIPRIAPTPFLSCMHGSIGAACPSVAGSSRRPIWRNAGRWRRARTLARLASLPPRLQHAAVELFRGTMVSHSFIAYRDDRAGESQPITFAGDGWRDYVPIALPWTVCVRERLPPGSVAVLINRAHTFTDLVLTVDAFEDRLLGAIDGKRTLVGDSADLQRRTRDRRAPSSEFLRTSLAIRSSRL